LEEIATYELRKVKFATGVEIEKNLKRKLILAFRKNLDNIRFQVSYSIDETEGRITGSSSNSSFTEV